MTIYSAAAANYAETVFSMASESAAMSRAVQFLAMAASTAPSADTPITPSTEVMTDFLNSVGKAPGTSTVVTVPAAPIAGDAALIQNVQTLDSYIAVLTALVMYNNHPTAYNLADKVQAAEFAIDVANARNYVVTGGVVKAIPMYLPTQEASTQSFNKSTTTADLHVDLIGALFGGLGLPATVLKELDAILTEIAASLRSLQLSFKTQTQTLDHFITFYHLVPFEGANPPVNQMKVEFIFLQLAQSSWEASVGKSTASNFTLDMTMTRTSSTMNSGIIAANTSAIISSLLQLTGTDAAGIAKMTKARGILSREG